MTFFSEKIQIVNGEPSADLVVISRTRGYALSYLDAYQVNPYSPRVKIVTNYFQLIGIRTAFLIDLGTYDFDLQEIVQQMKMDGVLKPLLESNPEEK